MDEFPSTSINNAHTGKSFDG